MQRGAGGAGSEQDERRAASWRLGQQHRNQQQQQQQQERGQQHPSVFTADQSRRRRRQDRAAECRYVTNASAGTAHCMGLTRSNHSIIVHAQRGLRVPPDRPHYSWVRPIGWPAASIAVCKLAWNRHTGRRPAIGARACTRTGSSRAETQAPTPSVRRVLLVIASRVFTCLTRSSPLFLTSRPSAHTSIAQRLPNSCPPRSGAKHRSKRNHQQQQHHHYHRPSMPPRQKAARTGDTTLLPPPI